MANYFVGPGGSDANNGTTYALRKLTINGAEDIPVVAGDTVYVAPGTYPEQLTCDVSGSSGNPITYIADKTGENTSGMGGDVRITSSNDDQTNTRSHCIDVGTRDFRTFRGFVLDGGYGGNGVRINGGSTIIVEDCDISQCVSGVRVEAAGSDTVTVRRCEIAHNSNNLFFTHSATVSNAGHVVENCMIYSGTYGIRSDRVGGITVRNCTITGVVNGIRIVQALAVGQTIDVSYSIVTDNNVGLQATASGEIVEDNSTIAGNGTNRTNVSVGASSNSSMPCYKPSMFYSGIRYPPVAIGELADWSTIKRISGSGSVSDDIFGMARPATEAKNSLGAYQYNEQERETTTTRTGGVSLRLADAGRIQRLVPVTAVSTVFSVYTQWESDYAGTKPQMIIRQPGVAATTVTATGSSGSWELLTTTITPSADTNYVVVEFVSNNSAVAGNYDTFFDDLTVT